MLRRLLFRSDLILHVGVIASSSTPEDSTATSEGDGDWQVRVGGGVDIDDPTSVGPAQLEAWSRFVGAPDDPGVNQGLLAFATEGMLIATAMRPHERVAPPLPPRTNAPSVLSPPLTFPHPFPPSHRVLPPPHPPFPPRRPTHAPR